MYSDNYGDDAGLLLAALVAFGFFITFLGLICYVLNGIFLMKLLKNADHRMPGSAWVPIWNTNSLLEVGGIKQPWAWTAVLFGGLLLSNIIPTVGSLLVLPIMVIAIILTIYVARAVQRALGIDSVGGIVLAVLLPIIWVIWMGVASGKRRYDRDAALAVGGTMPMNWFGESDRYAPFGAVAPAPAHSQPGGWQTGGYVPNPGAGYAPAQPQHQNPWTPSQQFTSPQFSAPARSTQSDSPSAWQNPNQPPAPTFAPPAAAPAQSSAPEAPRYGESPEAQQDGNRAS